MGSQALCFLCIFMASTNAFLLQDGSTPAQTSTFAPLNHDTTLSTLVQEVLDLKTKVTFQEKEIQSLKIKQKSENDIASGTVMKVIAEFRDVNSSLWSMKQEFDRFKSLTEHQNITKRLENMARSMRYLTLYVISHEPKGLNENDTVFQEIGNFSRELEGLQKEQREFYDYVLNEFHNYQETLQSKLGDELQSFNKTLSIYLAAMNISGIFQDYRITHLEKDISNTIRPNGIRLVNGDSNSGRVEVFFLGSWGTVCDDWFNTNAAKVVCRMLNKSWTNPAVYSRAHFGRGTGHIVYDNLHCVGNETDLFDCSHSFLGNNNCGHHEDVGVRCG